jgi:DNA-binding response OmpR family regulator
MNILLLEDDISLNKAISKVLNLSNHKVSSFTDGKKVLDDLSNNTIYDLYILDINVPNISGLELLKLIHQKNSNSKVIIITANNDIETLKESYNLGCLDLLRKPFYIEELKIKIERLNIKDTNYDIKLKPNQILTKNETLFLELLLENKTNIVTYPMIEEKVYLDKNMSMDSLRAMVKRLRVKLTEINIKTIISQGYKIQL